MAKRIRITQPGWEGFTGEFGMMTFTDGVSDELVSPRQFNVMAAAVAVEAVDEAGESQGRPGIQDNMKGAEVVPAPVLEPLARVSDEDLKAEQKADARRAKEAPKVDPEGVKFHSQAELEAIAEKKGIGGLREIGAPLGAKGRSINELVKEILKAEAKLKAQADALNANSETTREQEPAPAPESDVVAEGEAKEEPTEQPEGEQGGEGSEQPQGAEQSGENEKAAD